MADPLDLRTAYLVAYEFLQRQYESGFIQRGDDLGALLGAMSLLPDGSPADNAMWEDWTEACRAVTEAEAGGHYDGADLRFVEE